MNDFDKALDKHIQDPDMEGNPQREIEEDDSKWSKEILQKELDQLVKAFIEKHPDAKITAKLIKEPEGRGIYKGYKPNRISAYLLLLQSRRFGELEDMLFKDMEEYREMEGDKP